MSKRAKSKPDDDPVQRIRDLRAVFREVHRRGARALQTGDYKTFGDAVDVERSLIREQADIIADNVKASKPTSAKKRRP